MNFLLNRKLIAIGAIGTFCVVVVVGMVSCEGDPVTSNVTLEAVPPTPLPDADSPADTIKTLTAAVSELILDVEALHKANDALRESQSDVQLRTEYMERSLADQVQREFDQLEQDNSRAIEADQARFEALLTKVENLAHSVRSQARLPSSQTTSESPAFSAAGSDKLTWIQPLKSQLDSNFVGLNRAVDGLAVEPIYTIPQNATLLAARGMTALVGRVPLQNQVVDPMPFKVVTGAENLAANGQRIPGLRGMIWSGTAIGDWTLSCVSGRLHSATFVFDDGRIRTTDAINQGAKSLGWISDAVGLPCIPGERMTNVRGWLLANLLSDGARAAAEAAASSETVKSLNALGNVSSIVTGETSKYVLGKAIAGSTESLSEWLTQRAAHEFDAIFVPAGQELAIHVDVELAIDYEEQGRKLAYGGFDVAQIHTDLD